MNELLEIAIAAHGGLKRWNQVASVQAHASITGAVWHLKSRPDVLKDVIIDAQTRTESLTMEFPGQRKRSSFEPKRIVIEKEGAAAQVFETPVE